jgi:hypothetical protein
MKTYLLLAAFLFNTGIAFADTTAGMDGVLRDMPSIFNTLKLTGQAVICTQSDSDRRPDIAQNRLNEAQNRLNERIALFKDKVKVTQLSMSQTTYDLAICVTLEMKTLPPAAKETEK